MQMNGLDEIMELSWAIKEGFAETFIKGMKTDWSVISDVQAEFFILGIFNVSHALSYLCIFPCFLGLCHFDNVLFLSQDKGMKIDWSEIFDVPAEKFFLGYLWCFSCMRLLHLFLVG